MDYLIQTNHNPPTVVDFVKVEDTRSDQHLAISIPDELSKNQSTSVNNKLFKNYPLQQSTQNQGYQHENLINHDCDQLTRSIDQNTQLKVYIKSKIIYITVIKAQPDNMIARVNVQNESSKRNNINIYKGKVQDTKMDGYMKGLFHDVASLFIHLKFTDQLQFIVVKNEKKIISLNDNRDVTLKKFQNQEYLQYFLNFYKNQILPGDRFIKSVCSIRLKQISTQQKQKEQIKENNYKVQELKIHQLMVKNQQLQAAVKKYKSEIEGLQQTVQNLKKFIKMHQNKNQSQEQFNQIKRNQIQFLKQYQDEKEYYKKDRKQRKRKQKQKQKNIFMKRENIQMPIERMVKNLKINLFQDLQKEKMKKLQKQLQNQKKIQQGDEFGIQIQKSIKKNKRQQYSTDQNIEKKEQVNLHKIISQNMKSTSNPLNNHKHMQLFIELIELRDKREFNKQLIFNHKKHQEKLKYQEIHIQKSVRKYNLSVCHAIVSLFAFKYNILYTEYLIVSIKNKASIFTAAVTGMKQQLQFYSEQISIPILASGILPLASAIKNNKNITEFIKILSIEQSHGLCAYNHEFQPLVNVVNRDLLNLQLVIVSYPFRRDHKKKMHWTAYIRKEICVYLLGNYKSS